MACAGFRLEAKHIRILFDSSAMLRPSITNGVLFMPILPECPHCEVRNVMFSVVSSRKIKKTEKSNVFLQCNNCGMGVCGVVPNVRDDLAQRAEFEEYSCIFPEPQSTKAPSFTPPDVASDYLEAATSFRHGNIKSACIMAGSAIETAAVLFGAKHGGLKDKIKYLADNHIITPALAEWATEIKDIRVDAAHAAEKKVELTRKDAADAVNFTEMFLIYLFTLPGMVAERRGEPS